MADSCVMIREKEREKSLNYQLKEHIYHGDDLELCTIEFSQTMDFSDAHSDDEWTEWKDGPLPAFIAKHHGHRGPCFFRTIPREDAAWLAIPPAGLHDDYIINTRNFISIITDPDFNPWDKDCWADKEGYAEEFEPDELMAKGWTFEPYHYGPSYTAGDDWTYYYLLDGKIYEINPNCIK